MAETAADVVVPVPGPGTRVVGFVLVGRRFDDRIVRDADVPFLEVLAAGDLSPLDDWLMEDLSETAGIGFTELHGWVAAVAANLACGGGAPTVDFYLDSLEYAIGFGVIHA